MTTTASPKPVKSGWKTTEFWVTVAADVGAIAAAASGVLPHSYAALLGAVSTAAYALSRGLTKH